MMHLIHTVVQNWCWIDTVGWSVISVAYLGIAWYRIFIRKP